ncbi:MAG: hypothetical protein SH868_07560 [Bythopirellula sp.]|nr:hypothetical protein [Bythopirellula sp.]
MLRFQAVIFLLGAGCWLVTATGLEQARSHATEPLTAELAQPLTATWQGQELGVVLERISASQNVVIWLDRRVDPQQQVAARFQNEPLRGVLDQLSSSHALGWSELDGLIYMGPRESAKEIATLAATARNSLDHVSATARRPWQHKESVSWPRLSEPREILSAWLAEAGIELVNRVALPHDLWNAKKLPPLTLIDRVVLLLVGFDKTCEISANSKSCRIVPIERPLPITRDNQESTSSENRKRPSRTRQNVEQVFSLRLENQPVGKVVEQLAGQLALEVVWSPALLQREMDPRTSLVSCDVTNGNLPTLLKAVLEPAGLEFELQEKRLEILPGD